MADALRRQGNYADGSTFWIAAPNVRPTALTPERIQAIITARNTLRLLCDHCVRFRGDHQNGFCPVDTLFDPLERFTPHPEAAVLTQMLVEAGVEVAELCRCGEPQDAPSHGHGSAVPEEAHAFEAVAKP